MKALAAERCFLRYGVFFGWLLVRLLLLFLRLLLLLDFGLNLFDLGLFLILGLLVVFLVLLGILSDLLVRVVLGEIRGANEEVPRANQDDAQNGKDDEISLLHRLDSQGNSGPCRVIRSTR